VDLELESHPTNGQSDLNLREMLHLEVSDPEVVFELRQRPAGPEREAYAQLALRIGVIALRQANGALDGDRVKREAERLLEQLGSALEGHRSKLTDELRFTLSQYFDPISGQLPQRLERILGQDGELGRVLANHLYGETSTLARTLASHVGQDSPLLRLLDPRRRDGILDLLTRAIEAELTKQRTQILQQFSLDDKDSALSRTIDELVGENDNLRKNLASDLNTVKSEFSLDNEEGALARLVKRVEQAYNAIQQQFTLDNEQSALSRLKKELDETSGTIRSRLTLDDDRSPLSLLRRELVKIIKENEETNQKFQQEVKSSLAALQARKAEAVRSTRHGLEFEDAAGVVLRKLAKGDLFDECGHNPGKIPRSKVGDFVIELGPDSAAPGSRIVVEVKKAAGYTSSKIRQELNQARENREAEVGLFVLAKAAASGFEPFERYENDIVLLWDAEDESTDVILEAGLSVARALAIRKHRQADKLTAEIGAIDKAIAKIAKEAEDLSEISKWALTVHSNGEKIRSKADQLQKRIADQIRIITDNLNGFKADQQAA
jgi:hypothetical protein